MSGEPFPLEQFKDVFELTPKIKNKLQPFIAKYREVNMDWIMRSFELIHEYTFERVPIIRKFNAIFALKFLFDTGEVFLINLIEIYFLEKIFQVALTDITSPDEKRGVGYFVGEGYPPTTPDIAKFGYNYVRLACEFIENAAKIKPRQLFESDEIKAASMYTIVLKSLREKGYKPYDKPAYYKENVVASIRAAFEKHLQDYPNSIENIIEHYEEVFKNEVYNGQRKPHRLDPRRILEDGDVMITGAIIEVVVTALPENSFLVKKNALALLKDFTRWADIQAAHVLNCTPLIEEYLREVASPHAPLDLPPAQRGKLLWRNNKSPDHAKQEFYLELLTGLQFWALCYPSGVKLPDEKSRVKQWHDELKNKLGVVFPEDKAIKDDKSFFDRYEKRKRVRNNTLLEALEGEDRPYQPLSAGSKLTESPAKAPKEEKVEQKTAQPAVEVKQETPAPPASSSRVAVKDYDVLSGQLADMNAILKNLCHDEASLRDKMGKIEDYQNNFTDKLSTANVNDAEFDELFGKCEPVSVRLEELMPHLDAYQKKQLSFQELKSLVHPELKPAPVPAPPVMSPEKSKVVSQSKVESKKDIEASMKESFRDVPQEESRINEEMQSPSVKASKVVSSSKLQEVKKESSVKVEVKKEEPSISKTIPKEEFQSEKPAVKEESIKKPSVKEESLKSKSKASEIQQALPDSLPKESVASLSVNVPKMESPSVEVKPIIRKEEIEDLTPIKKMKDSSGEPFLPQESKQSANKNESAFKVKRMEEEPVVEIQPASLQPVQELSPATPPPEINPTNSQLMESQVKSLLKGKQEEVEDSYGDEGAHAPKSMRDVSGSMRLKDSQAGRSSVSGRGSSRVNFESRASVVQEEEDDFISMPEITPLEMSYHELGGVEQQLRDNKELSFKKCFEADKYLLGRDQHSRMMELASQTASLIRPTGSRRPSRNKAAGVSIPELLHEKNKQHQEDLEFIENQKNVKIRELETKIRVLENEGSRMKQNLAEKDVELKHLRTASEMEGSGVRRNTLLQDQDQLFRKQKEEKRMAQTEFRSNKDRSLYGDSSVKEGRYLNPQGALINTLKYQPFLGSHREDKQKKNMLKNKELLYKGAEIEFGCMSQRQGSTLFVTFYVTPEEDLTSLVSKIVQEEDSPLQIDGDFRTIPAIKRRRQEKIVIRITVKDVPYTLPEIEFSYTLSDNIGSKRFVIPCPFHKLVHLDASHPEEVGAALSGGGVLRGEEVPYSRKIIKSVSSLGEYLPGGGVLNGGYPNDKGELEFGGRCEWQGCVFTVRILVRTNQFLYIQGAVERGEAKVVEFYIAGLTHLLKKNVELMGLESGIK